MRIRLLSSAVAVVATVVLAAPVAAPADAAVDAAGANKRCVLKGSTTIKKNRFGRVFERTLRSGDTRLYGCLYSRNRRILLDEANGSPPMFGADYGMVKLNGRFVAWRHTDYDDSCRAGCESETASEFSTLYVANLRTRKQKVYDGEPDSARALVVTRTGAIAWIQAGNVFAADAGGERALYEGRNAVPSSLRLSGRTVSWTVAGQRMSATLRKPQASAARVARRKKPSCSVKQSKTVKKNRFVRVYTVAGRPGSDEVERLYACLRSTGRKTKLDTKFDDEYVTLETYNAIKLNGRQVAWQHRSEDYSCKAACPPGYNPVDIDLRVANVRTRRKRLVDGNLGQGSALVVTRSGAIAWIEGVKVRANDADGMRELDPGPADPESLRLRESTVSWRTNGVLRTATLG